MPRFATAREAKEFLISRIVTEAQKHGTALSEVERKMLYFSETGWTSPDIAEVSATFDQECNQAEYEAKIARLINQVWATDRKSDQGAREAWKEAVRQICSGDHYLLVMIDQANRREKSWGHIARLALITIIGCSVALAILWIAVNR